jgi:hypothetical protein
MKRFVAAFCMSMILISGLSACSNSEVTNKIENAVNNNEITSQMKKINEMLSSLKSQETVNKYKKQIMDMLASALKSRPGFVGVNAENFKFTKVKDGFGRPYFGASVDISVTYKFNGKIQKKTENVIVAYDILTNSWRIIDGGSVEK